MFELKLITDTLLALVVCLVRMSWPKTKRRFDHSLELPKCAGGYCLTP